jgi:hypothetical protein
MVAPLAWFFRTLSIARQLGEYHEYTVATYLEHVGVVVGYFTRYDILLFAFAAKIVLAFIWRSLASHEQLRPMLKLSLIFTLYCIVHALLIGKIPNRLFTRYFITLQPLLVLTFALDLMLLAYYVSKFQLRQRAVAAVLLVFLLVGSVGWAFARNHKYIEGRLYEISHQYEGVLDFVIPFLQENYDDTSQLVIATNYEETSYIYYLDSRVIVGFANPVTLSDPMQMWQERPDCIINRRFWKGQLYSSLFSAYRARDEFTSISLPIVDYGFNNIPEVVHWTPETGWDLGLHLFRTAYTDDPQYRVTLFLRKPNPKN